MGGENLRFRVSEVDAKTRKVGFAQSLQAYA